MKKLFIVVLFIAAGSARAADIEEIAFERLASDAYSAGTFSEKLDSFVAYVSLLDRVGSAPSSPKECIRSLLAGVAGNSCKSTHALARSGGSTGGAD